MPKCIICGNAVENEDYEICNNCVRKNITLENVLGLGKDSGDKVEINGFIASFFKSYIDEMEDILIEHIRNKCKSDPDNVQTALREYVDEDIDSFVWFLEEKCKAER